MKELQHKVLPLVIVLCAIASLGSAADQVQGWQKTVQKANKYGLRAGMTASQVEEILGKPDNADWTVGVVRSKSTIRIWLRVEKRAVELASWKDFVKDRSRFGVGHFFLLIDDRLESSVPSLTTKDFSVLYNLASDPQKSRSRLKLPRSESGEK